MSNFDEKTIDRIKKLEREVERLRVKESPGAWLDWTPTLGASGSMTYTATTINHARYSKIGKLCFITMYVTGTTGGTASYYLTATLPFDFVNYANFATIIADGTRVSGLARPFGISGSNVLVISKYDSSNFGLGAGREFVVSGVYEVTQ